MNSSYLLDASAVLALIANEPGAELVMEVIGSSSVTAINLAEVVKKLKERGVPSEEIRAIVADLQIPVEAGPGDYAQAIALGELAAAGREFGLSLGDAVCLAVAGWTGMTAVTADRRWAEAVAGVRVLGIR